MARESPEFIRGECQGGPGRLHYFDSFHVATAKLYKLPLITSDRFILQNSDDLRVVAMELRKV
jgi:hypothetical protein